MRTDEQQIRSSGLLAIITSCPLWCALFLLSLLLPTDFSVYAGGLRLSPYRVVLLAAFIPTSMALFSGRCGRLILPDYLITAFAIWNMIVLGHHHGMAVMLQSGGVQSLELLGAYLIARTSIRTTKQFVAVAWVLMLVVLIILPFAAIEWITGNHIIKANAARLTGSSFYSPIDPRYGFTRAWASFDHPILWGVFASSTLGLSWYLYQVRKKWSDLSLVGFLMLATVTSMSAGAIVSIWAQLVGSVYERMTRRIPARWRLFWFGMAAAYILVEIISTRSAIVAITTRISFSSGTAYGRTIIYHYGMQNVKDNPIMGIGFNEWARPTWLHASVDNFWLLTTMTYGVPGFLLFAGSVVAVLFIGWKNCRGVVRTLRTGWTITMAGMIVACATVHLWNNVYVYFTFLIGCGAVFCTGVLNSRAPAQQSLTTSVTPVSSRTAQRFFQ